MDRQKNLKRVLFLEKNISKYTTAYVDVVFVTKVFCKC